MKKQNIRLGLLLIGVSLILHAMHFFIFEDMHHIMIFLFADIAFIPLEVFFVSLILERLIKKQEEQKTIKKMHMLVGLFYQKFGDDLLCKFVRVGNKITCSRDEIRMDFLWTKKEYNALRVTLGNNPYDIDIKAFDFVEVFQLLKENEFFIMNLISNPHLEESDTFSDLMLALFHLDDELGRRDLENIIEEDLEHLKKDCIRVYKLLSEQWVDYIEHLQTTYPYLFLNAVTHSPYDERSALEIRAVLESTMKLENK